MNYYKLDYNRLPQYGFGSWLKKNAGTIGTVAGVGLGALGTVLLPGAGTVAGFGLGTSIGAMLGGSVGGAVQQDYQQDQAAADQEKAYQQQLAEQQEAIKKTNFQNKVGLAQQSLQGAQMNNNLTMGTQNFAYGGPLSYACGGYVGKKMANGGNLTEYTGQTHNGPQGGIPVDGNGAPVASNGNKPVALVEDGELAWMDPTTKQQYIFSNRLKYKK